MGLTLTAIPSLCCACIVLAGSASAADPKVAPLPSFTVQVELTAEGNGSVASVRLLGSASESTPEGVRQAVLKKAQTWRFEQFNWQGKPAQSTFSRYVTVNAVPAMKGGYALQVQGFNFNIYPAMEFAPTEDAITYRGMQEQYFMLFRVAFDVEGHPLRVERAASDKRLSQGMRALVGHKEKLLANWRQLPAVVNGRAVACTRLYVMQKLPDRNGMHVSKNEQGWYDGVDITHLRSTDAELARTTYAAIADACPPPRLVTLIKGELL